MRRGLQEFAELAGDRQPPHRETDSKVGRASESRAMNGDSGPSRSLRNGQGGRSARSWRSRLNARASGKKRGSARDSYERPRRLKAPPGLRLVRTAPDDACSACVAGVYLEDLCFNARQAAEKVVESIACLTKHRSARFDFHFRIRRHAYRTYPAASRPRGCRTFSPS